jgi:hypothetical protein
MPFGTGIVNHRIPREIHRKCRQFSTKCFLVHRLNDGLKNFPLMGEILWLPGEQFCILLAVSR